MKKYKIIAKTNGWIANRDAMFNGKCEIILESNLTLKQAYKVLLRMFNNKIADDAGYSAPNWGVAVNMKKSATACKTFSDGTRTFEYDSRYYSIVEDEME